jgi:predicted Zn-dependent protease
LAQNFEMRGQLEDAEQIYTELYKVQPTNYQFYNSLFNLQIKLKKYNEAKSLVENQIPLSNSKVNLYGDLGSVYFLMGDEKKSAQIWDEALDLEPENPFAYRIIANYLIENRDLETAIDVLNKGNEKSDDHTLFSYDVANLYSIVMNFEAATKEYCKLLLQKPKQLSLVQSKIIDYLNANMAAEPTFNAIEEYYEDHENVVFLELLADLYTRVNNDERALEVTILLDQKTSNNGSTIFNFGQKSERYKKYNIASQAYEYIINNFKSSALYSESEIGYTKSLESELDNRPFRIESWKPIDLGKIKNVNEYKKLLSAYKTLVAKYPNSKIGWEAEFRTAKIYQENLKDYNKADSVYNKILDEMKSLQYIGDSNIGLAQISIKNNKLDKAEKLLNNALMSKMSKDEVQYKAQFLLAKTKMWQGHFTESISIFKETIKNTKEESVNNALEYLLILNTFKNDSTNLFSYVNSDYLIEKGEIDSAIVKFKLLADNKDLFLLKDFAAIKYAELLIALNNYQEAGIFLDEVSNCDVDNIYLDRFLFLSGSNYYYGLNNSTKAMQPLNRIFEEFPNSIYFNKARKIITEINTGVGNAL